MKNEHSTLSWKDYYELCKPNVVFTIVFTAIAGMFLAVPGMPPINLVIYGTIGIGLASASAAAINHFIDQKIDAKMARTHNRPLPTGKLNSKNVLLFAAVLGVISMVILVFYVNTLTAVLTFLSHLGYSIIYTIFLKHATPQNIVIGGAFGATPPVLGWCAITGEVHPYALLLFLIIFIWTPPHFWPLAVARRKEYTDADIPMLPVTHGVKYTQLHIFLYTILLFIVSLLPYLTGMSGIIYLFSAILLGIVFIYFAIKMMSVTDNKIAKTTFFYSLFYIVGIFTALLVDHYYPISLS